MTTTTEIPNLTHALQELSFRSAEDSYTARQGSSLPLDSRFRRKAVAVLTLLCVVALFAFHRAPSVVAGQNAFGLSDTVGQASEVCGEPPSLGDKDVHTIISSTKSFLIIANPEMRCTIEVRGALDTRQVKYELHTFETPFIYALGISAVWDWLHCSFPDDRQGTTIMHSYVFFDGEFLGQGFAAAAKIQSGELDRQLSIGGALGCDERFPSESYTVHKFMDAAANRVLVFGWIACPCTNIVQERLGGNKICFDGRTWADPSSKLMAYLQCKEGQPNDHSFVYFREAGHGKRWTFVGNGFRFADTAMSKRQFTDHVKAAGADKERCDRPSVHMNVYGTPLEECRVGVDVSGSWLDDGTCSEQVGGIHEICIESLPADFSSETHQTPWSQSRVGRRHCVCIGAWSLYMTDAAKHLQNAAEIMPHCRSIPETAITQRYVENWGNWNGYPASVVTGIGELVSRCFNTESDTTLKCGLKTRFLKLVASQPDLANALEVNHLGDNLDGLRCPS